MTGSPAGPGVTSPPRAGPEPALSPVGRAATPLGALLREGTLAAALVALGAVFTVLSPEFLGPRNLSMLAIELAITAVLALGMLLVILPGHIDLSAGSGVGLVGGLAAVLVFEHRWPAPAAMAAAVVAAILVWRALGVVIVREKIPAFIITLGGLLVFKGLHWLVIHDATVPVARGGEGNLFGALTTDYLSPAAGWALAVVVIAGAALARRAAWRRRRRAALDEEDAEWAVSKLVLAAQLVLLFVAVCNRYRGVPVAAVLLGAVVLGVHVLTQRTRFGRHLYAIGGNEEAAFLSGVPVARVVIGAYALMGAAVGLTGLLQTAYAGASTTTVGSLMELDAVAACVIGGASLRGGRGTVGGVLFGALLMATLLNGMTLLAVSPETKLIARGSVLALAVWLDVRLGRRPS